VERRSEIQAKGHPLSKTLDANTAHSRYARCQCFGHGPLPRAANPAAGGRSNRYTLVLLTDFTPRQLDLLNYDSPIACFSRAEALAHPAAEVAGKSGSTRAST
jgi:hypothetical protein